MRPGESIFIVVQACTLLCPLLILWENIFLAGAINGGNMFEQEGRRVHADNNLTTQQTPSTTTCCNQCHQPTHRLTGKATTRTKLNKDGVLVHLWHNIAMDENMWEYHIDKLQNPGKSSYSHAHAHARINTTDEMEGDRQPIKMTLTATSTNKRTKTNRPTTNMKLLLPQRRCHHHPLCRHHPVCPHHQHLNTKEEGINMGITNNRMGSIITQPPTQTKQGNQNQTLPLTIPTQTTILEIGNVRQTLLDSLKATTGLNPAVTVRDVRTRFRILSMIYHLEVLTSYPGYLAT